MFEYLYINITVYRLPKLPGVLKLSYFILFVLALKVVNLSLIVVPECSHTHTD